MFSGTGRRSGGQPHADQQVHRRPEGRRPAAGRRGHAGRRRLPQVGVSEATYFRWRKQIGDLGSSELRELRQLRDEVRRFKQLVAELSLDKRILQDSTKRKW